MTNKGATIERGEHDERHPYVVINKRILDDEDLSADCVGVLSYMLSRPDDWKVYVSQVAKRFQMSKGKVYSILKELSKVGYVIRTQAHVKGRYSEIRYQFFENKLKIPVPFPDKSTTIQENLQLRVFQHAVKQRAVKRDSLLSNDISSSEEIELNTEKNTQPLAGFQGVRDSFGKFVKLTKEEKTALEETYTPQNIESLIEEINDFLASTGKKPYKDYAATIRNWARRRGMVKVVKPGEIAPEIKTPIQPPTKADLDMIWMEKVREKCPQITTLQRQEKFLMFPRHVEFVDVAEAKFYYGEHGFRAKVDSSLRKLNIIFKE